jgi:hypothetical protein
MLAFVQMLVLMQKALTYSNTKLSLYCANDKALLLEKWCHMSDNFTKSAFFRIFKGLASIVIIVSR